MQSRSLLEVDIDGKLPEGVTMEVILVVFNLVEDFLYSMVSLQRHS